MQKREFAIITGERKTEIEFSGADLVWVISPEHPEINKHFCFFKNVISKENTDFIEFELVDGTNVKLLFKRVAGLEIIARKDTRQYDVLVETLLQINYLKTRVEKIEKNFN